MRRIQSIDYRDRDQKSTIMERKFDELNKMEEIYFESIILRRPRFIFFYDKLMDPVKLAEMLQLQVRDTEGPLTRPAFIMGYTQVMRNGYPSLIGGPPESIIHGMALDVTSPRMARWFAALLTIVYVNYDCIIRFEDGETVSGMTFKWRGNSWVAESAK